MSSRETLAMYGLAFVLLMTNLPCIEGISNQGTCGWICTNDTDIDEESRNMLANRSLVKFCIWYKEQVRGECAKQTVAKNSSATASLWLKIAAGSKPRKNFQGRLQLVTHTILEGILGAQFASGACKEVNVSCEFKSTPTGKSGSNYSSERLTFHNLSSVLYFVEQVANSSKPCATFVTLLRTEKNTSLSVGVTSTSESLSSAKSENYNELIVTDGWLAVAIIICIVVLLYFPAIFILFQPSEIKLKVPRETREVQGGIRTAVEHEGSGDPESHPPQGVDMAPSSSPSPRNSDSAGPREGWERADSAGGNSLLTRIQPTDSDRPTDSGGTSLSPDQASNDNDETCEGHVGGAAPGSPAAETKNSSNQDSENTTRRLYQFKSLPRSYGGGAIPVSPAVETKNSSDQDFSENTPLHLYKSTSLPCSYRGGGASVSRAAETKSPSDQYSKNTRSSRRRWHSVFSLCHGRVNKPKEVQRRKINRTRGVLGALENTDDTPSQMEPHDTDPSASHSNGPSNGAIDSPSPHIIIDMPSPTNEEVQQERSVQSQHVEEVAIIVGETYPIGFGSWIGNKLFSTTHERNIAWNIIKFIFLFSTLPLLLFLGLGDFFLVFLPKLHSRLSDHLPFPFLTRSLGYAIIDNHPYLLVPIMVISALAYLFRLFCFCFFSRSTLEAKWQSCSVHRMHPIWFACKLLQYFISELPSSLNPPENCCNPAPPECSKYLDLPENISHNLEKQPDIFIKCWECCSHFWKLRRSSCSLKGILLSPAVVVLLIIIIIIFIIIGIFCTSPLVCLCHGRFQWGSRVLQSVPILFSLVWVTILSLICAIPLGVAIIGLIKVLGSHTNEMLPQVTIAVVMLYHFWSCYRSFRTPYRYVANFLASRYQKKYDEQENGSRVNSLIHYKQGDLKIIPKELFDDGCKEFKLSIKNDVALLLFELGCTLLAFCFFFPIPGPSSTSAVISFLAVAYGPIKNAINEREFLVSDVEADKVVDDYIARKQRDSSQGRAEG